MADTLLPSAFAELEPYAEAWCLPTESERWDKRMASTMIEMREFHEAFFPRLEEAIEYCDKFPLDDIPEDARAKLEFIWLNQVDDAIAAGLEDGLPGAA